MPESLNTSEPVGFGTYKYQSNTDILAQTTTTNVSRDFVVLGVNSRTGFQNPHWKDQCRLGSNATTNFSGTKFTGDLDRSFWSASIGQKYSTAAGNVINWHQSTLGMFLTYPVYAGVPSVPPSVQADVHNRCIRKFLEEVTAAQSSENLTGRSIKHFRHDMHALIHPMSGIQAKISSYLTSLEKVSYGKLKGRSLYNTLTSAYLEFKFGVQPFVQDVTDITIDMVIRDRKRNPSVPVQGTAHSTFQGSVQEYTVSSGIVPLTNPHHFVKNTSTYSERIKGAVRTGINDDGRLGFVQDNRLLPKDWAPTAFSILPYAWMVNYFTNIRDIIDAASFRFSDLVWACQTYRTINEVVYTDVICDPMVNAFGPPTIMEGYQNTEGGNAAFTACTVTRSPIFPSDLVPSFEFTIPTTPTPWLNMMAAFSGRIANVVSKLF